MRSSLLAHLAPCALLACSVPRALAPAPPAPARMESNPPPAFTGAWSTYHATRFALFIPLPDGVAWQINDHDSPWLIATHPAMDSTLEVRSWTEDGRALRARCEERARLWRTLPDFRAAEPLRHSTINAPDGFDTRVQVGLWPGKTPSDPIHAFAIAFGAHAHRCITWIYMTHATGPGAESILGERLAAMVDGSLGRLVLDNPLVPAIPHTPAGPARRSSHPFLRLLLPRISKP